MRSWSRILVAAGAPAGATLTQNRLTWTLEYAIPDPEPASFAVRLRAQNDLGFRLAIWTVTVTPPPARGAIVTAGDVYVNVDAADPTAGTDAWANPGTLSDLVKVGNPVVTAPAGVPAVTLNCGATLDAYQTPEDAPAGLVGPDPTRSIEVWAFNPGIADEETLVAWGRRGGLDGTNMSFNYGANPFFGAVGHWGAPDIGWNDAGGAPAPDAWHHLVYTYDGITTRVYADGAQVNFADLGAGIINTFSPSKITLAAQIEPDGMTLNGPLAGTLSLGRVRIHDGVLSPYQVMNNYLAEKEDFPLPPPPPDPVPELLSARPVHRYSFTANADDSIGGAHGIAYGNVAFADDQAALANDGTQNSNSNGQSPPAAPPGAYVDLPGGIISVLGNNATFESWLTWSGPAAAPWQRIFDFGTSAGGEDFSDGAANQYYIFLTPASGDGTLRCGYRDGPTAVERFIEAPMLSMEPNQHIVVTWDGGAEGAGVGVDPCSGGTNVVLCLNGREVARDTRAHISLAQILDLNNWLGRSQWGDAMFGGSLNEFRIYDYALSPNQVFGNFQAGPDTVNISGTPEVCDNNIDDDGDQAVDCNDSDCSSAPNCLRPVFHRGDTTAEGSINITDGVAIFNWLFLGGTTPKCLEAANANDAPTINITTGVYLLNFLFLGGPRPPDPGPGGVAFPCGPDPASSPSNLGCEEYNGC